MEHLTKHQLVLVALLVSFVTSLATGIVTVSLMDQMPPTVVHTISQVIDKTIQQVTPDGQSAAAGSVSESPEPTVTNALNIVSQSIVKLKNHGSNFVDGIGLVVTKGGMVVTNKSTVAGLSTYDATFADGQEKSMVVTMSQNEGDLIFLIPTTNLNKKVTPIKLLSKLNLGQDIYSLSGTSSFALGQGLVTELSSGSGTSSDLVSINTSISPSKVILSSPLFDINGNVVGILTSLKSDKDGTTFYPISLFADAIPR